MAADSAQRRSRVLARSRSVVISVGHSSSFGVGRQRDSRPFCPASGRLPATQWASARWLDVRRFLICVGIGQIVASSLVYPHSSMLATLKRQIEARKQLALALIRQRADPKKKSDRLGRPTRKRIPRTKR